MSGGSLNYFYSFLEDHVGDFGDKELDELVKDLAELFHAREWFMSSDTCEGAWNEARDRFKHKWFREGARGERIDRYLEEIRDELMRSFGLSKKYCQNCMNWTPERNPGDEYGACKHIKGCLMHRYENCEMFEEKEDGCEDKGDGT